MRKLVLEVLTATALTLGSILASTPGVLANDVMVKGAFARASAMSTAKAGAVYMTLSNQGAEPDKLLQIKFPRIDAGRTVQRQYQFNDHGCFGLGKGRCHQRNKGTKTARPDATHEMTHSSPNLRQSPPHA